MCLSIYIYRDVHICIYTCVDFIMGLSTVLA